MTTARPAKLYSPALLALATELAHYPLGDVLPLMAEARSRTCGSVVRLGLALDSEGRIARVGMQVTACAIGQASASLLARNAAQSDPDRIAATGDALAQWLAGEGDLPDWPGLEALAAAREHPGRHGALLLPWTAARMALSSNATGG